MEKFLLVDSIDIDGGIIKGRDKVGDIHEITIDFPWNKFLPFINKLDEISILTKNDRIDKNGYLILEPHYLVATTSVVDAMSCPRKLYINTMGASDLPEIRNQLRMIEGNALHNVFSLKIVNGELKHEEMVEMVIDKIRADLVTLAIDEDQIVNYLNQDAIVFDRFNVLNGTTELDCQNWKYGIHGKFDAVVRKNIIELKSSRINIVKPWENHNAQIEIYKAMMSDRDMYTGSVYYVRDGKMIPKKPYDIPLDSWLRARNWAYLAMSTRYTPMILRGNEAKICSRCFYRKGCSTLCAKLKNQRDCYDCTHNTDCDKKEWSDNTKKYYLKLCNALFFEEHEVAKEQKSMARVGMPSGKYQSQLVKRGYALITTDKITEKFIDGYFEINYKHKTGMNRFRRGDIIRAYDTFTPNDTSTIFLSAVIKSIDNNSIVLQSINSLPERIVIIASSSTASYRSGRRALYFTTNSKLPLVTLINNRTNTIKLPEILHHDVILENPLKKYNTLQLKAISQSLLTPDIFLIQGPAGTGKTSVITEIINQLFNKGKKILVSAFTNMAVDNIGKQLMMADIPFFRLGNRHSINKELHGYMITNRQNDYITAIENDLPMVILSTTSTIARDQYVDMIMDYVILDEAAQMTVPESLKAILHGEKAILVGDHKQLQPIVRSDGAKSLNLHVSLFEELVESIESRFILLELQYRMNKSILDFPNRKFYNGKLKAANDNIANHAIDKFSTKLINEKPYQLISIKENRSDNLIQLNTAEAVVVVALIRDLLENSINLSTADIGVITPFRAQVSYLRELLPSISIDTVDRYQGSEKDIIILSTITTANIPILSDPRRMNVALTRARKKLFVLVTNPRSYGLSLINELYKDSVQRDVVTHLNIKKANHYKDKSILKDNIKFITNYDGTEMKAFDIYDPYSDLSPIIGNSAGIFYSTILLLENECEQDTNCVICYREVQFGVQCIGCTYWYHTDHLVTWIKIKNYCPVCKHSLLLINY